MIVSSLICHAHIPMALDCLGSVARLCEEPIRFQIHDDGSLTGEDHHLLEDRLPVERIISREEADACMQERLAGYPSLMVLRKELVLALKLLDGPSMRGGEDYLFCDSDIFVLRRYSLPVWASPIALMRDRHPSYSMRSWGLLCSSVKMPACANSGFIYAKSGSVDLDFLEWFVSQRRHRAILPMLEQTAWAALGMRVGCEVLDGDQVRVMREGEDTESLVAGHFTARTRHLLPKFVERSRGADVQAEAVRIRVDSPGRCTASDLAVYEVQRVLSRMKGKI